MGEDNPIMPAEVAAQARPRPGQAPLRSAWIWIGLVLALIGRMLSLSRQDRTPDLWILAFFFLPYAILTRWAYAHDTGRSSLLRGLRAALFALLTIEAFYWGISMGGLAAAAGACVIYARFIRPRKANPPQ